MTGTDRGWRILNAEPSGYDGEARGILSSLGRLEEAELDREGLLGRVGDADVLVVRLGHRIDREVLGRAPRLRAIVTATTGLDHVDLGAARERGVAVLSLRGETEFLRSVTATAELTWALLLALVRRLPGALAAVRRGEWHRDDWRGRELSGLTLGVVGLGRLGRKVARYGLAFEMTVVAHDPFVTEWVEGVGREETLEGLLRRADVVSLHVPLDPATRGLIGRREIGWMKPGARLVNTSRGAILDEEAIVEALEAGNLAGVAVDVVRGETSGQALESPLVRRSRSHDDILVTPHIGGATLDSMAKTERFMARRLASFLEGLPARELE
jgi:D-3-phosphoglycerate dehydrogenase